MSELSAARADIEELAPWQPSTVVATPATKTGAMTNGNAKAIDNVKDKDNVMAYVNDKAKVDKHSPPIYTFWAILGVAGVDIEMFEES